MLKKTIWKFEAQGDTVYIGAFTIGKAWEKFAEKFGECPISYIKVTEVKRAPKGEEVL